MSKIAVENWLWVLTGIQYCTGFLGTLAEVVLLSGVDDGGELDGAHGVAHPRVEHLVGEGRGEVGLVIESSG